MTAPKLLRLAKKSLRSRQARLTTFIAPGYTMVNWKRALSNLCHEVFTAGTGGNPALAPHGRTWTDLALAVLKDPGEDALEACYALGGEPGLKKLVEERWWAILAGRA